VEVTAGLEGGDEVEAWLIGLGEQRAQELGRRGLGLRGVELSFDVRELDPEMTTARLKAINETVLPIDVGGRIDRSKLVEVMLRSIAPALAKELLVPQGAASQKMFDDVRDDLAQMRKYAPAFTGEQPRF
jgi:hypothetical protein